MKNRFFKFMFACISFGMLAALAFCTLVRFEGVEYKLLDGLQYMLNQVKGKYNLYPTIKERIGLVTGYAMMALGLALPIIAMAYNVLFGLLRTLSKKPLKILLPLAFSLIGVTLFIAGPKLFGKLDSIENDFFKVFSTTFLSLEVTAVYLIIAVGLIGVNVLGIVINYIARATVKKQEREYRQLKREAKLRKGKK